MEIVAYKLTQDDWYPNFFLDDRETNLIRVSLTQISPLNKKETWRVAVWGNDDIGMNKDFENEHAKKHAVAEFQAVFMEQYVNKEWLRSRGWENF